MALNSQRPMLCSFLYPPPCRIPLRTFTTTAPQRQAPNLRGVNRRGDSQATPTNLAKKQAASQMGTTENDFGILPDTVVMPTGSRLPSLFTTPADRLKLEWVRFKGRCIDFASVLYYKFGVVRSRKYRPRLDLGKTKNVAKRLHRQMYTSFAEGDKSTLSKICAKGLLETFSMRINKRARGESYEWKAERYIGKPKVVCHRVGILPEPPESTIRQAIVRIRSRQILEKVSGNTREEVSAKDMDEYLVVQKIMVQGVERDWVVWGTTRESDPGLLLASA